MQLCQLPRQFPSTCIGRWSKECGYSIPATEARRVSYRLVTLDAIPPRNPVRVFETVWQSMAPDRLIGDWGRFDPMTITRILPWILLLREEGTETGLVLRYRICGEGCRQMFGFSYQDQLFGEGLPPEAIATRLSEFAQVRAGSGPIFSVTELPIPDKSFKTVYRGVFAFRSEDGKIDRILVVIAPQDAIA
jgi:hypothetical protein